MRIAREEIFGPVLCVQSFESEEEAIALANGTDYGLGATVWTQHMGRAKRLVREIRAGEISVCTGGEEDADPGVLLSSEPQKASGFGSELGIRGLQSYSTLKLVTFRGC
jgi:acyl-CoA reductase-like NAD-dependent aldehyde dehydrogenase